MFKPKFRRQEVTEEDLPKEDIEEDDEELAQEDIAVPQPQYAKPIAKQEPQVEGWRVEEVPTATQPVIYNSKTKKMYTFYEALAELLNRTEE